MRTRFAFALLLVAGAGGGCLFEPRDAEPPATGSSVQYLPRVGPRNVWQNCELALNNTDASGWDNAVHDSFIYEPDSQTRDAYPAVAWDTWGKTQEMAFISGWFNNRPQIQAQLLHQEISTPEGSAGEAIWDIIYYVKSTDRTTGSVTKYAGRATLQFRIEGSYWFLTHWRDESGEQDPDNPGVQLPTLGVVRGAFSG